MAINGTKAALPALQPAGAFLRDLEIMLRTLVAGAVIGAAEAWRAEAGKEIHRPQNWSSQMSSVTINGRPAALPDDPDALLADVLRDDLALTGTKLVCGAGVCGACTVLLDGVPIVSCLTPAETVAGRSITTVEGIGGQTLHPVQKAFMALDALQCGFCTPGFIVEAAAFHDNWRKTKGTAVPSREEIGAALSGHLCRCGAYENILRAVADACAGRFDGASRVSPRVEARDKVTGAAKYTLDIHQEGQLEGLILRSQAAHAKITRIDFGPALAIPGVKAAISLLGEDKTVRFVGEQIAAVAAVDRKTALAALDAIKLISETMPAAIGLDAARKAGITGSVSGQAQESRQRLGGRGRSGALERQCPRPEQCVLAQGEEGARAGSPMRAARTIRCWSRACSAPARNSTPASSRMSRSRASMVTSSPCTSRPRPCFT